MCVNQTNEKKIEIAEKEYEIHYRFIRTRICESYILLRCYKNEIEKLSGALEELEDIASHFYEDFENTTHNFREFYRKLKNYLQSDILGDREISEEFADILRRVLSRLEEVESIDASASFECLKSTMSIYLLQESKPGRSANWIVRNFEQIDGDICEAVMKIRILSITSLVLKMRMWAL